jgi:hypothetical protein
MACGDPPTWVEYGRNDPYSVSWPLVRYSVANFADLFQPERLAETVRTLPPPPTPFYDGEKLTCYGEVTLARGARCVEADALYQTPDIGTVVNGKWVVIDRETVPTDRADTMGVAIHYANREHPNYVAPTFPSVRTTHRSYELAPAINLSALLAILLAIVYAVAWFILQ